MKEGMLAIEVIQEILRNHPEIEGQEYARHQVRSNWSEKYQTDDERKAGLLDAYTHYHGAEIFTLQRDDVLGLTQRGLEDRADKYNGVVLSATSRVKIGGVFNHIAMINFHPENGYGVEEIKKAIDYVLHDVKGVLLESGRHYHYYGDLILDQREWTAMIGKMLVPFNLVRPGSAGYALIDGCSKLRVTEDNKYKPKTPQVVYLFK